MKAIGLANKYGQTHLLPAAYRLAASTIAATLIAKNKDNLRSSLSEKSQQFNQLLGLSTAIAECSDGANKSAEETAAELDKIFKEEGGMLSQEELMEMVMKRKNTL